MNAKELYEINEMAIELEKEKSIIHANSIGELFDDGKEHK